MDRKYCLFIGDLHDFIQKQSGQLLREGEVSNTRLDIILIGQTERQRSPRGSRTECLNKPYTERTLALQCKNWNY